MRLLQRLLLYGFWHCVFYEHIHCSKIPPSFIQSTLVLFKVNGTENTDNTDADESTEPVSVSDITSLCAGVFVTRQHVLTTSKCALATKKLQMKPQRLLPKPFTRRRRTSMSRDAITGKKTKPSFCAAAAFKNVHTAKIYEIGYKNIRAKIRVDAQIL